MPGWLKITVLALVSLATLSGPRNQRDAVEGCLPEGIKASDVVSAVRLRKDGSDKIEKTTVEDKLRSLGARCENGKLVNSAGKEVCFYRLVGCWGNPPFNFRDILRRQNEELARLREHCTVIEMTCNPSGAQPQ
jgi:hypothetical protein